MGKLAFQEENHLYFHDGKPIPGLTSILAAEGFIKPERYTELGRERGSAVHRGCEDYDRGGSDWLRLPEDQIPYIEAWAKYCEDYKFKPIQIEQPVHSHIHGFAATPDAIGPDKDDEIVIVEVKTGAREAFWPIQTAAQAIAFAEEHGKAVFKILRRAVQLMPNGKYKLDLHVDPKDYDVVKALMLSRHWKTNHIK